MQASALEFRLRFIIGIVIYLLGFIAPWNILLHLDSIRTWQYLAAWPARSGWLSFSAATIMVLVLGILCAVAGAFLRTWGSAYLAHSIAQAGAMHGEGVVAAGPYRYLRNPLYLGTFFHTFALALLMQPSGAIFCIVAIVLFQLRLIFAEESFLTAKLGAPYLDYCAKVPRLFPSLTARIPASPMRPSWPTAFLSEIYMWGVAISFAALGWRYNSVLIIKGVLISLGLSLIVRAFLPKR
ncbi:isoprenylcysteine carboxylmethyltransferase family protein [Tunturiibacter empetritectus]|uniref:Protein-S-isoprenylcysteine O-methyltransferase Ste14 n=1 Tax=Tunturiibacter lichenicola TaxID=2051959 RepID=A0A852VGB0_9BACT|nr:isoprenylcysteine carboxylmethyltransferase family protein [Edaphobacter lichenicola]NYF91878.1 protein-S-isoprenylcysteine O-methyltransferase Ste14 [Edaphobacter lichenicola]